MAHGTPQDVAAKWSRNAQNAAQDYVQGVNRVTVSPTAQAAAAVTTWQARVSSTAAAQKYVRKLNAVTLEQWKARVDAVGQSRYSQGVSAAESKFQAAMVNLLPFIDNLRAQIKAMPNATLQDRIQRANAWINGMAQYQGQA